MRLELERAGETIGGSHVYFMNTEATLTLPLGYWEELGQPLCVYVEVGGIDNNE